MKESIQNLSSEQPIVRLEVRREDIHPETPESGGTVLVLQRNAKDDRSDPTNPEKFGALVPESAEVVKNGAKEFFDTVFQGLTEQEREKVRILVVASNAVLAMPSGEISPHRRAVETAEKVIEGIEESLKDNSIRNDQLLNESASPEKGPVKISGLVDLTMFEKSPEFVRFLKEKYGSGKDFWLQYEIDSDIDQRLDMGAEGPSEIAIRMRGALTLLLKNFSETYHVENPDTRLYIWSVSHYDSISPWLKGYVYQADPAKIYVPVEHGGGVTVKIDREGKVAETTIGGETFKIPSLL